MQYVAFGNVGTGVTPSPAHVVAPPAWSKWRCVRTTRSTVSGPSPRSARRRGRPPSCSARRCPELRVVLPARTDLDHGPASGPSTRRQFIPSRSGSDRPAELLQRTRGTTPNIAPPSSPLKAVRDHRDRALDSHSRVGHSKRGVRTSCPRRMNRSPASCATFPVQDLPRDDHALISLVPSPISSPSRHASIRSTG
jgi:hypothetical protein